MKYWLLLTFLSPIFLVFIVMMVFFSVSTAYTENVNQMSIFECGYKSYFFSRFSFSIHFFFISLIFLFLDLEICVTILMLSEMSSIFLIKIVLLYFVILLLGGLIIEWMEKKLDWVD